MQIPRQPKRISLQSLAVWGDTASVLTALILLGCVHQVSWTIAPIAGVRLPSTEVAVIAYDRACKPVADALVDALGSRPGIEVRPEATQRITVQKCDDQLTTALDIESNYPGLTYGPTVYQERRRYTLHGWARGEIVVEGAGDPLRFSGEVDRSVRGPWVNSGDLDVPASATLRQRVSEDLASRLADHIAPLPETIERIIYPDPEPGTARKLHNDAVAAERAGNLDEALRLAREAYAADPSPGGMDFLEAVQDHASQIGYAFRTP